jgi:hypothetical protein
MGARMYDGNGHRSLKPSVAARVPARPSFYRSIHSSVLPVHAVDSPWLAVDDDRDQPLAESRTLVGYHGGAKKIICRGHRRAASDDPATAAPTTIRHYLHRFGVIRRRQKDVGSTKRDELSSPFGSRAASSQ